MFSTVEKGDMDQDNCAAARSEALRAVEEAQIVRLSAEDQKRFAEAIINPPAPTDALRRAAAAHMALS